MYHASVLAVIHPWRVRKITHKENPSHMKITKKDAKIIRSLKPATERILSLFEVSFTGPDEKSVTVCVAANDETEAARRVRNGIHIVDRLKAVTNLGFVRIPA
jgi:hypothetical protein